MILAIDLGTTYFKFTLLDRTGQIVRIVRVEPSITHSAPGRYELEADHFHAALDQGIGQVLLGDDGQKVSPEAISFATQTNSFLLLDETDQPLTPIILWPDDRAQDLGQKVKELAGGNDLATVTGVPELGSEFMVAKLLWIQRHRPEKWADVARISLISDFLTLLCTGQHVTEAGTAGLTGLVDIRTRRWSSQSLRRFDLAKHRLPQIVTAGTDLGPVLPSVRQRWGLPASCRFVVGCLDQYAGGVGVGNVGPGVISETTGTVLSAITCATELAQNATLALFQGPAWQDRLYYRMAFGSVGANYLHWYREQLIDAPSFGELCNLAASVPPGADGVHIDRRLETPAEAIGKLAQAPRAQVVRAILEAVAFALADHIATLGDPAITATEIRAAGGGALSRAWLQIKADVLGVPIRATTCPEPTSLGAAILAESALSCSRVDQIAEDWVELQPPLQPERGQHELYRALRG